MFEIIIYFKTQTKINESNTIKEVHFVKNIGWEISENKFKKQNHLTRSLKQWKFHPALSMG
jgi:hypothetical protein